MNNVFTAFFSATINFGLRLCVNTIIIIIKLHVSCAMKQCTYIINAHAGVYLYFDGDPISNNSYINLDEQSNFRIDCNTNKTDCCRSSDNGGNWYFPNGGLVSTRGKSVPPTFILTRRTSTISLSVYGLGVMERGRFHCRVPNSNDVEEDVYVRLCKYEILLHTCTACIQLVCQTQ